MKQVEVVDIMVVYIKKFFSEQRASVTVFPRSVVAYLVFGSDIRNLHEDIYRSLLLKKDTWEFTVTVSELMNY